MATSRYLFPRKVEHIAISPYASPYLLHGMHKFFHIPPLQTQTLSIPPTKITIKIISKISHPIVKKH